MHKPALLVHRVFHLESDLGRIIAHRVHAASNNDLVIPGLRMPTVFCTKSDDFAPPGQLELDQAEWSFVVVLADIDIDAN